MKLLVEATKLGFDGMRRQKPGEQFTITDESQFSWAWMVPVGWTPKKKQPQDWEDPRELRERQDKEFKETLRGKGKRKSSKLNHDKETTEFITAE